MRKKWCQLQFFSIIPQLIHASFQIVISICDEWKKISFCVILWHWKMCTFPAPIQSQNGSLEGQIITLLFPLILIEVSNNFWLWNKAKKDTKPWKKFRGLLRIFFKSCLCILVPWWIIVSFAFFHTRAMY